MRTGGDLEMMGQVVSIEEFRRQRLDRELKKRLKAAQDDLAKAYRAQRDLIDDLRQARCPTCNEERILEIMERASYAMIGERAYRLANGGRDPERTLPGPQRDGHELSRFLWDD
jgi:hypothetical protein